jgi:hypothetical protein
MAARNNNKIESWEGRLYGMRAVMDLLVSKLNGPGRSHVCVAKEMSCATHA